MQFFLKFLTQTDNDDLKDLKKFLLQADAGDDEWWINGTLEPDGNWYTYAPIRYPLYHDAPFWNSSEVVAPGSRLILKLINGEIKFMPISGNKIVKGVICQF